MFYTDCLKLSILGIGIKHMIVKILVTGANGFLGSALTRSLSGRHDYRVVGTVRSKHAAIEPDISLKIVGDLGPDTRWQETLAGIDVVIHTAARAHVLNEKSVNPQMEFTRVNVDGTLTLARHAGDAGVKRFIFISSIGVNGASTTSEPFTEKMIPNPHAMYAVSKYEAELALIDLCHKMGMELTIIRPPLVYAANAPGNFARLLKIVRAGYPLPLASVKNQRSFIYLENLVDFISCCIEHPLAANETFIVSDGEDISTPQLIRTLAAGMNKSILLFPVPNFLLQAGSKLLGREPVYQQLCGSLQVDISKAKRLLDWAAPFPLKNALAITAEQFMNISS